MFQPTPATTIVAFRVRASMERDLKREAKKRNLAISEEIRRRLKFYADHHAAEPQGNPQQPDSTISK